MRILCRYKPCGPSFVLNGWARVFQALGHQWVFHDERQPLHDLFASPVDLYLGTTYDVDRPLVHCLERQPACKVVLYASAWGDLPARIDPREFPIDRVQPREKALMGLLRERTGKPDLVWLHLADKRVESILGGWRQIGCQPVGLLNAADTFSYWGGQHDPELACDVAFLGGYWKYKARSLDPYLLPLCHPDHPARLRIKIWGNQPWPVSQYLGFLPESRARDVFASALVCPNISEPHSQKLGYDLIERPFKVFCAGGFCVSDRVEDFQTEVFTAGEMPALDDPTTFQDALIHFVRHPEERQGYIQEAQRTILAGHTYWHRVEKLLRTLNLPAEAENCRRGYEQWVQTHALTLLTPEDLRWS